MKAALGWATGLLETDLREKTQYCCPKPGVAQWCQVKETDPHGQPAAEKQGVPVRPGDKVVLWSTVGAPQGCVDRRPGNLENANEKMQDAW